LNGTETTAVAKTNATAIMKYNIPINKLRKASIIAK